MNRPERWIVTVELSGEISEPTPYLGAGDDGGRISYTSYGTSYQGVGPTPEDARASAKAQRASALPDLEEVLGHLEDAAMGAQLSLEAAEPIPTVSEDLVEEMRRLLGTRRVPLELGRVSKGMLLEWITALSKAVAAEELEGVTDSRTGTERKG